MRGEVGGTAADDPAHRTDFRRSQGALGKRPDADRDVDVIVDQVQIPISKDKPDVDLGPSGEKLRDDRENMQAAKNDWRGDDEIAPWRGIGA